MPTFTVILPLYNQAHYVADALGSVLSQTCGDLEVIVVDDGSTDDGLQVVKAQPDSRVRPLRQANQGVSVARNRGIEMAKGDYIAFIDADDLWLPTFLERSLAFFNQHPSVSTVYTNVIQGVNARARIDVSACPEGIVKDYFLSVLRYHRHLGIPSSAVIRKEALRQAGGFPAGVKYYEDHDLWMRLAWVGKVGFIAEPLSFYRDNPSGAMSRLEKSGVPYPSPVETYRRWKSEGRIPAAMQRSSQEFINWTLLGYVCNLANLGDVAHARRLFQSECQWTTLALRSYAIALLLCTAPSLGRALWRYHEKHGEPRAVGFRPEAFARPGLA